MSTVTTTTGPNQQSSRYDIGKIFLRAIDSIVGSCTNDSYDDYEPGTLMGRVAATGKLLPLESDASDGSQYPVGVLMQTVEAGDTIDATICTSGEVAEDKLILLKDGDDLDTIIDGRQLRDRIGADTVGVVLVAGSDNTINDN